MVHDDDVLDPEEVLRDRDRAERVDRAATTTGKIVVVEAVRFPAASRTISPGYT